MNEAINTNGSYSSTLTIPDVAAHTTSPNSDVAEYWQNITTSGEHPQAPDIHQFLTTLEGGQRIENTETTVFFATIDENINPDGQDGEKIFSNGAYAAIFGRQLEDGQIESTWVIVGKDGQYGADEPDRIDASWFGDGTFDPQLYYDKVLSKAEFVADFTRERLGDIPRNTYTKKLNPGTLGKVIIQGGTEADTYSCQPNEQTAILMSNAIVRNQSDENHTNASTMRYLRYLIHEHSHGVLTRNGILPQGSEAIAEAVAMALAPEALRQAFYQNDELIDEVLINEWELRGIDFNTRIENPGAITFNVAGGSDLGLIYYYFLRTAQGADLRAVFDEYIDKAKTSDQCQTPAGIGPEVFFQAIRAKGSTPDALPADLNDAIVQSLLPFLDAARVTDPELAKKYEAYRQSMYPHYKDFSTAGVYRSGNPATKHGISGELFMGDVRYLGTGTDGTQHIISFGADDHVYAVMNNGLYQIQSGTELSQYTQNGTMPLLIYKNIGAGEGDMTFLRIGPPTDPPVQLTSGYLPIIGDGILVAQ